MLGRDTEADLQSCVPGQWSGGEEERQRIAVVLVSYCCITNHPKIQWLNTQEHLLLLMSLQASILLLLAGCIYV